MCQLNIYCVPKSVEKEKVLSLIKETMGYQVAECIDEETPVPALKDAFSFYISGGMRCNCGSALCSYQDYEDADSWQVLKENLKREQLKKLNEIKEIMEQADYPARKKQFEERLNELWEKADKTSVDVGKKERELTEAIFSRTDISEEEKQRLIHEEVYPEVTELMNEAEKRPERIKAMEEYRKFCDENQVMWQSVVYTLERDENVKDFCCDEINDVSDDDETFEFILPSNCIYDAIGRAKNEEYEGLNKEFDEIKLFAKKILEFANEIKILCYWQDGNGPAVDSEKTLSVKDFRIDDAIFLKYNELLTLTK